MSRLISWKCESICTNSINNLLNPYVFEATLVGTTTGYSFNKRFTLNDIGKELESLLSIPKKYEIKRVIFNNPATIILWKDGTKTVVKCQKGDKYDKEKGFVMCYLKKLLGNDNTFNKEIGKWVSYEEDEVEQIVTNKVPKEITFTVKVHSEDE